MIASFEHPHHASKMAGEAPPDAPFTAAFIKEALRLYPPQSVLDRRL
jgi:cytochrome P450